MRQDVGIPGTILSKLLVIGFLLANLLPGASPAIAAIDAWTCDIASNSGQATPVASQFDAAVRYPDEGGSLTIFAAASLTDPFTELAEELQNEHDDLDLTLHFAGSQALVTQLVEGARAGVLATASMPAMDRAIEEGAIDGFPYVFATNQLAIAVPASNPGAISHPQDLGSDDLRVVLAAEEVPVGDYSRDALCSMQERSDEFGSDFVARVAENVVSEENNVKAVLAKVVLGEADAGIVYSSDVTSEVADEVIVVPIPEAFNAIARYPIAVTDGENAELAQWFIGQVFSERGSTILERYGFVAISS